MKPHCAVALLCLGAMASVTHAQEIRTNCDKNIDFSHYQTYSWKKLQTNTPVWQSKVQAAVDKSLAAKGWRKVIAGADVIVSAEGLTQTRQEYESFDDPGADSHPPSLEPAGLTVVTYRVGTFLVSVSDSQNKQQVWSGIGTIPITGNIDADGKSVDKAVDKMFRKFPPPPAKSKQ
ncbi:MAG TPA: DUF4136 domain-containing protein [Candidatus Acidoferrum sp.]|nr:DUF4136 domain-containing protein [Candidatus Acidoferrum sp.]